MMFDMKHFGSTKTEARTRNEDERDGSYLLASCCYKMAIDAFPAIEECGQV